MKPVAEQTEAGLDRFVGYAEILEAYPVSKSTIERAWRGPWKDGEPRLPKPGKARGRAVWPGTAVNAWGRQLFGQILERSASRLEHLAQADPANLAPEELEEQALNFAAQALTKRTGQEVATDDLSLHLIQELTLEQFALLEHEELQIRSEYLARLPLDSAIVLAAAMLPQLRAELAKAASPELSDRMADQKLIEVSAKDAIDYRCECPSL